MNDEQQRKPHVTGRIALLVILLGLVMMGVGSMIYLKNSPGLIKGQNTGAQSQAAATQGDQMNAMIGVMMRKLAENPDDLQALTTLGTIFLDMQEWQSAEAFLSRGVAAAPSDPMLHYMLGLAQVRLDKINDAHGSLQAAVDLGGPPEVRYSLGILFAHYLDRPQDARPLFRQVVESPLADDELRQAAQAELDGH